MIEAYKKTVNKVYCYDLIGMFALGKFNVMTFKFIENNIEKIKMVYEMLEDDVSKKAFVEYLKQKITGEYQKESYDKNQYFPDEVVKLNEKEIFFDCGAFDGDTSLKFIEKMKRKKYDKIYACEMDSNNCKLAEKRLGNESKVKIINKGVWSETKCLHFSGDIGTSSRIDEKGGEKDEKSIIALCKSQ